jgi:hypothetical protein
MARTVKAKGQEGYFQDAVRKVEEVEEVETLKWLVDYGSPPWRACPAFAGG